MTVGQGRCGVGARGRQSFGRVAGGASSAVAPGLRPSAAAYHRHDLDLARRIRHGERAADAAPALAHAGRRPPPVPLRHAKLSHFQLVKRGKEGVSSQLGRARALPPQLADMVAHPAWKSGIEDLIRKYRWFSN